jgi:hypothetical protein
METDTADRGQDSDLVSRVFALLRDRALENKQTYSECSTDGRTASGDLAQMRRCRVFNAVAAFAQFPSAIAVFMEEAEALVQQHGLQLAHLQEMLEQYAELNLIDINPSRTRIDFVVS